MTPFQFPMRWLRREGEPNALAEARAEWEKSHRPLLDLTVSNPTQCGMEWPRDWIEELRHPAAQAYHPNPQGELATRQAIAEYYADRGEEIRPEDLFLTAGTSQAYSHLFKLLCDPGDHVLVPKPSYPLIPSLAELEHVVVNAFDMRPEALREACHAKTRVVCLVQPNNPTGKILSHEETEFYLAFAEEHGLALIVDEVFSDFTFTTRKTSVLHSNGPLVFTLNGFSKCLALPQLKLAWIHVGGSKALQEQAKSHLEWICDAFLSVGSPAQFACPGLLRRREEIQQPLRERLQANLHWLRSLDTQGKMLPQWPDGGWCLPHLCPGVEDDEQFAISLLRETGTLVHPGYLYDFDSESYFVVSLLPPPEIFQQGMRNFLQKLPQAKTRHPAKTYVD